MRGLIIFGLALSAYSGVAVGGEVSGLPAEFSGSWSVACDKGPSAWRVFKDGKAIGPGERTQTVTKTQSEGSQHRIFYADGSSERFEVTGEGLRYLAILRPDGGVAKEFSALLKRCAAPEAPSASSSGSTSAGSSSASPGGGEKVAAATAALEAAKARREAAADKFTQAQQLEAIARRGTQAAKETLESAEEGLRSAETALIMAKGGYAAGQTIKDCGECPEMVVVPAGSFMMGSPANEPERYNNEGPQHRVTLGQPFAVGKYEVTFAEWDACVAGGGCDGYRPQDQGWGRGRRPVIYVSWNDAKAYVAWLSRKTGQKYRLLSESEWEYAARAGTTTPFSTGQRITTDQANFNGNDVYNGSSKGSFRQQTVPVGSFKPNGFGLYDMHGNVWEWVEDCSHGDYGGAPTDGRAWTVGKCELRGVRGGSWLYLPRSLRSAYHEANLSGDRDSNYGFRVARLLTP